ncbi:nucleotidyltransferase domain-containing protein [Candidatus Pacearchaeota archaeon]|nr:nucleotidyltransferase domain-containing protein [Candidatus Pacearchaeota archaeon]
MLKIINDLSTFFEDCYREISVREYAREMKITPPTASNLLKDFAKEDLLNMRKERGFLFFYANRESLALRDFSRVYWRNKLNDLVKNIWDDVHPDSIVLFGSLTKLEVNEKSDIDIAIFVGFKKEIDLKKFEKKLGKEIQVFRFESLDKVNKELRVGIMEGYSLKGVLR